MRHLKRTKVAVADLKVGMFVCELDRPWLELPFEPPFQIQGFRIASLDDIDKIGRYCSHVYVELDHAYFDTETEEKPDSRTPTWLSKLGETFRSRPKKENGGANDEPERVADSGKSQQPPVATSADSTSLDRTSVSQFDDIFTETERVVSQRYEILSRNSKRRIVYQDQTTVAEELEPAKIAIADVSNFYDDLTQEIVSEKQIQASDLHEKIDSMAKSIIRNPDALSYIIHLKAFNRQTYSLAISSCVMTMAFARFLGLNDSEIRILGTGALLQDVGMIGLPAALLDKPDRLTKAEHKVVQRHARRSTEIVNAIEGIPREALEICLYHHERFDGSGYPEGLRADQIPLMAMITGIVDTYMALVSFRPYRKTATSYEALSELTRLKHTKFLGALVDRFVRHIAIFPVGSFVKLNSGHVGIVVGRNPMHILEPKVMLVLDPAGKRMSEPMTVNFAAERPSRFLKGIKIIGEVVPNDSELELADFFT